MIRTFSFVTDVDSTQNTGSDTTWTGASSGLVFRTEPGEASAQAMSAVRRVPGALLAMGASVART
jgi:hypothetical protein